MSKLDVAINIVENSTRIVTTAAKTFLYVWGGIYSVMIITRLIYALGGKHYDPMDELWKSIVIKKKKT